MNKSDTQKAITIFMISKNFIDSEIEIFTGDLLDRMKKIERSLHIVLFKKSVFYTGMMKESYKKLLEVTEGFETERYNPTMVGLHILGDQREFLAETKEFNLDFDEIDSLCDDIDGADVLTKEETSECNRIAVELQKRLFGE